MLYKIAQPLPQTSSCISPWLDNKSNFSTSLHLRHRFCWTSINGRFIRTSLIYIYMDIFTSMSEYEPHPSAIQCFELGKIAVEICNLVISPRPPHIQDVCSPYTSQCYISVHVHFKWPRGLGMRLIRWCALIRITYPFTALVLSGACSYFLTQIGSADKWDCFTSYVSSTV